MSEWKTNQELIEDYLFEIDNLKEVIEREKNKINSYGYQFNNGEATEAYRLRRLVIHQESQLIELHKAVKSLKEGL